MLSILKWFPITDGYDIKYSLGFIIENFLE